MRARLPRYLAGLLARIDGKDGWQIAEAIGGDGPPGARRLLSAAHRDAEAVRDDLRARGSNAGHDNGTGAAGGPRPGPRRPAASPTREGRVR